MTLACVVYQKVLDRYVLARGALYPALWLVKLLAVTSFYVTLAARLPLLVFSHPPSPWRTVELGRPLLDSRRC